VSVTRNIWVVFVVTDVLILFTYVVNCVTLVDAVRVLCVRVCVCVCVSETQWVIWRCTFLPRWRSWSSKTSSEKKSSSSARSVCSHTLRHWGLCETVSQMPSRKNEETRLDAFEMKRLRKILLVSWTAKKTNEWVLNKAGIKRELLDTVKARKLSYYGHTMRKQGSCLEKEIMQGTMPGARRRGRPRTAWMENINTWTGLPVEESVRMTEDRDKWRKYVHGVANRRIKDGWRTEQNSS